MASALKRFLVGKPLASSEEQHQRLGKPTALAVFASDAVSALNLYLAKLGEGGVIEVPAMKR